MQFSSWILSEFILHILTTSLLSSDETAKKKNERENFADHLRDRF